MTIEAPDSPALPGGDPGSAPGARRRSPRVVSRGVSLALLAAIDALLAVHLGSYWFLTDDAFISFRYARNLFEGHGRLQPR